MTTSQIDEIVKGVAKKIQLMYAPLKMVEILSRNHTNTIFVVGITLPNNVYLWEAKVASNKTHTYPIGVSATNNGVIKPWKIATIVCINLGSKWWEMQLRGQ